MSVKVSTWVWEHARAKGNARLVLLALADVADDEGWVRSYKRSLSYLVSKTLLAESTVRAAIARLDKAGELAVVTRGTGRESATYRVIMDAPQPVDNPVENPETRVPKSGTLPGEGAESSGTEGADLASTQGADSSGTPSLRSSRPQRDDDAGEHALDIDRLEAALSAAVDQRVTEYHPRNPHGYRAAITTAIRREHGKRLYDLAERHPHATPAELAEWLWHPDRELGTPPRSGCERCGDTGVLLVNDDTAKLCPDCHPLAKGLG